jgi:RND family efflux transporter MFP subunit
MRPVHLLSLAAVAAAAFLVGWYAHAGASPSAAGGRHVLYYRDPMHPSYRSDKPGVAPDCGMQLEPVYEGQANAALSLNPAGSIEIPADKRQLLGLRTSRVEETSERQSIRLLGRVVVEDTRLFRVTAATDGWVRQIFHQSAGYRVRKNERLATIYSPEFLTAEQAYLYALSALDRFQNDPKEVPAQIALSKANVQQAGDNLRNMGMGEPQLEEMKRTRELSQEIGVYAPTGGIVLSRTLSPGQRFDKGAELYRCADLSHVWIVADMFERESPAIRPGQSAVVRYNGRTLRATTSQALPLFDPATRTMKFRLDMDNPEYLLRPDMFVDVDLPVDAKTSLSVPVDAVIDSGLRQLVYVEQASGVFAPRQVETGSRFDGRVRILKGLEAGEQVVTAGNFLLDSESRMRLPPAAQAASATDPVCGMALDTGKVSAHASHNGQTFAFCSRTCMEKFRKNPAMYLAGQAVAQRQPAHH